MRDGLLGASQFLVGALQGPIEPRLVSGQGHMLTELFHELAIVRGEPVHLATCRQQRAEYRLLGNERDGNQRP